MKSLLLLFTGLLMMRCGTDQGAPLYYDYKIENNSTAKVDLIPYFNGQPNYNLRISMANSVVMRLQKEVYPPYNDGLMMSNFFVTPESGVLTHVEIVFDNTKKVLYQECTETNECYSQPRNIFNPLYNGGEVKTYTITSADFQNAANCNGNCY